VLNEPGGSGDFYLSSGGNNPSGSGKQDAVHSGFGQFAVSGQTGPGSTALVSPPHTVLAGETLSFSYLVGNSVALSANTSMSFTLENNQQARARPRAATQLEQRLAKHALQCNVSCLLSAYFRPASC
jgi:hypothetical protein